MKLSKLPKVVLGGAGGFFAVTFLIYFFNLDMKFAACLIKPLTAYYNWSGSRRKKRKEKQKEKQQE